LTALTLIAHALTPALRGLVLGGDAEPDRASLDAAGELKVAADQVYSGPEPAAIKTAEALGLDPTVEPALRDRDYGSWTGREELLAADPTAVSAWLERPHTAPPEGESANDLITRVADWLGDLVEPVPDKSAPADQSAPADVRRTVAAVVHPAVVRAVLLCVLEAPAESIRHVDVRPLAVVRFSEYGGRWSLLAGS
jgi:broad specificity phosphatase PhoE